MCSNHSVLRKKERKAKLKAHTSGYRQWWPLASNVEEFPSALSLMDLLSLDYIFRKTGISGQSICLLYLLRSFVLSIISILDVLKEVLETNKQNQTQKPQGRIKPADWTDLLSYGAIVCHTCEWFMNSSGVKS